MNKNAIINEFLLRFRDLALENPNLDFQSERVKDTVYHYLTRLGVNENEKNVDLSSQPSLLTPNFTLNSDYESPLAAKNSTFNNWIKNYAQSRNTRVFISEDFQYFCQFVSRDKKARMADEHIKVYIPLDAKHIEFGAKMIFDFLDTNKISHTSKVGRKIRFDNVVVRLINPQDADRLIQFVKSNHYIQEGLIEANPFAFQQDGIALAVDGRLSYNETVATLITNYIDFHKRTNTLKRVNVEDFYNYVQELYSRQFLTHAGTELEELFNWRNDKQEKNYREVISLIIKAHNKNFKFQDYVQHYATAADIIIPTDRTILETNRLLIECIQVLTEKYGREVAISNMRSFYYYPERLDYITRTNNLRSRVVESDFHKNLKSILTLNHLNYDEYVERLVSQYHLDPEPSRSK